MNLCIRACALWAATVFVSGLHPLSWASAANDRGTPRGSGQPIERFRPLELTGQQSIELRGCQLRSTGTVEFVTAATESGNADRVYCVLANSDEIQTRLAVLINGPRTAVGMTDGLRTEWVSFPMNDGEFHHVALATCGDLTEVYVDDLYIGYLPIGYGPQRNLRFHLGSRDGTADHFVGKVAKLRLWDSALTLDDLMQLKSFGPLPPTHPAYRDLLAASRFTDRSQTIALIRPQLHLSDLAGAGGGNVATQFVPNQSRIQQIRVRWRVHNPVILNVEPIFAGPNGQSQTPVQAAAKQQQADAVARSAACLRALKFDIDALGRRLSRNPQTAAGWHQFLNTKGLLLQLDSPPASDTAPLVNILRRYSPTAAGLDNERAVALKSSEFSRVRSSLQRLIQDRAASDKQTGQTTSAEPTAKELLLTLEEDEVIVGCAGTYGTHLNSLRFITNKRIVPEIFGEARGPNTFVVRIPLSARCVGFVEYGDVYGIGSLRLAYTVPLDDASPLARWASDHPLLAPALHLGRFVAEDYEQPVRDDEKVRRMALDNDARAQSLIDSRDGSIHIHGNYTSFPVSNLWRTVHGDLVLGVDDPASPDVHSFQVFSPVETAADLFRSQDSELRLLSDGGFQLGSRRFRPPTPYDKTADARDKIPWGGTFSTEQRPTLAEFNFKGYNVAKLDPRNYQLGTGTSKRLFAWPADGSSDYQTTSAGKIIPNGLFYRSDRQAMERARSHTVCNLEEHKRAWNVNLGLNIGVEGVGSFGLDASYQNEKEHMSSHEGTRSVSQTREVKYALVLDRSRVQLAPEFRSRVLRMRDAKLAGITPNYARFVDAFGTNYPYAVTYGGMAYQEMKYTAEEIGQMHSQGFSISNSASATLEGVTVGRTLGGGYNWSDASKTARKDQEESVQTIGGEISKGGGWSLPDHSEVPVLLDLRPLDELLSPIFFDDPIVWREMRGELQTFLHKRAQDPRFAPDSDNFGPRYFEFRMTKIENLTTKPLDFNSGTVGLQCYWFDNSGGRFGVGKLPYGDKTTLDDAELFYVQSETGFKAGAALPTITLKPQTSYVILTSDQLAADNSENRAVGIPIIVGFGPHQFRNKGQFWLDTRSALKFLEVIPSGPSPGWTTSEDGSYATISFSPATLHGKGEIILGTPGEDGTEGDKLKLNYSFRELSLNDE